MPWWLFLKCLSIKGEQCLCSSTCCCNCLFSLANIYAASRRLHWKLYIRRCWLTISGLISCIFNSHFQWRCLSSGIGLWIASRQCRQSVDLQATKTRRNDCYSTAIRIPSVFWGLISYTLESRGCPNNQKIKFRSIHPFLLGSSFSPVKFIFAISVCVKI